MAVLDLLLLMKNRACGFKPLAQVEEDPASSPRLVLFGLQSSPSPSLVDRGSEA